MRPRRFSRRRDADAAARTTVVQPDAAVVEEEVVQRPPRPRPPEIWPWLLLLLLLVVGGLAAAYFLTRDDNDKKSSRPAAVTIPNVVGMKQDAATQQLHERGLASQILTRASKFPKGTVFAQAPGQGTKVARGAQVQLTVSAVSLTKVPNVVGLKSSAAVGRLKAAGLSTQVVPVAGTKAAGTVLSQSPAAAQTVGKGSTVSIKASRGTVSVPDVVGQNAAAAKSALTSAGLKPSVFTVPNAAAKGTVVAQKPIAATKAPRGSNIRINVSNGSQGGAATTTSTTTTRSTTTTSAPATVMVPKVVGLQQGSAQRRLSAAHLGVRVIYVTSQQPSGQVVSQSPSAGASVKRGAKVTIRVSLGPSQAQTAVVPDVTGEDQQTATSQLQSAGFSVQVIEVPAPDPSQGGTVLDEQPAGGTRAPKGSQVTIYVGQSS